MGTDIHAYVYNNVTDEYEQVLKGGFRNYEFFGQLSHEIDGIYDQLYVENMSPKNLPKSLLETYEEIGGYGSARISCKTLLDWYFLYSPDRDAGWCTRYEKWAYDNQHIIPELQKKLYSDDILEDMCFIEITNEYSPWKILFEQICEVLDKYNWAQTDCTFYFFFDC